jgi:hypothetical protein
MIQLSTVASSLEKVLNDAIAQSSLSEFHANTNYTFKVYSDVGAYKKASRSLNTINRYINCILKLNGDDKSGVTDETISAVWNAQFECLVPHPLDTINLTDANNEIYTLRFVDAVEDVINSALASSTTEYINDGAGTPYYVGANYSSTVPGLVDTREAIGESIPLSVFIEYTIVATGISSASIKLELIDENKDERIFPTRLDIIRTAVQEGNIASNSNGISKVTTQGTLLSMQVTMPLRNGIFDTLVKQAALDPTLVNSKSYRLSVPVSIDADGNPVYLSRTYTMTFSEVNIAAETNLGAACTASLVEELGFDDLEV